VLRRNKKTRAVHDHWWAVPSGAAVNDSCPRRVVGSVLGKRMPGRRTAEPHANVTFATEAAVSLLFVYQCRSTDLSSVRNVLEAGSMAN
jgi:hypothetical protein